MSGSTIARSQGRDPGMPGRIHEPTMRRARTTARRDAGAPAHAPSRIPPSGQADGCITDAAAQTAAIRQHRNGASHAVAQSHP